MENEEQTKKKAEPEALSYNIFGKRCRSFPLTNRHERSVLRNGTERNRSKKWNAEGLRSDGTTSNRTVPLQKLDLFNK